MFYCFLQGQPEPDWKNFFCWDEPGRLVVEEREIPLPTPRRQLVRSIAPLAEVVSNSSPSSDPSLTNELFSLCKGGIPSLMRPYVWMEISGARWLKKRCAELFEEFPELQRRGCHTAFEFLVRQADSQTLIVFDQIEQDMRELQTRFGITGRTTRGLLEVPKVQNNRLNSENLQL